MKVIIQQIKNILFKIFLSKEDYLRKRGVKIGYDCNILSISFGSEPYLIELGNSIRVTSGVKFFTHGGANILRYKYPDFDFFGKIKVGNNVYIGSNSLILPGVVIGDNVVIGAGSVVTKSLKSGGVYAGNPARYIKSIEKYEEGLLPYNLKTKGLNAQEKKKVILESPEKIFIKK